MKQWKLMVGLAMLFVLGVLVGSIGTVFWVKIKYPFLGPPPPPGNPKAFILDKMTEDLSLTDSQRERIDVILESIHSQMIERFHQHRREEDRMMEINFEEIKRELTPGQVTKLEKLKSEFDENRKKHGPGFPPPPRPK